MAKTHLQGSDQKMMEEYLHHHLVIAGVKQMLFDETAVTAIHHGSSGLFREANHLARGALVGAARNESQEVMA